jgi:hypothetical protein
MSDRTNNIVQSIERAPASSDGHTHNFEQAYRQIVQMQNQDGGPQSHLFKQDMADVNRQLQNDGVLPNLQIVGADNQGGLVTRDVPDHQTAVQHASNVNDFGALGSGNNSQEAPLGLLAKEMGVNVTRNPDNSYDVQNPFDNPQAATSGILGTVLSGLVGDAAGSSSPDGSSDQSTAPLGMNSILSQSWKGWDDAPSDDAPADDDPQ